MGLLDGLNFDDPQTMSLLSAAAAMADRSGPSLRPTSLGQIMGGGFGAYQQSMQQQQKDQQDRALRELQIKTAQGNLQDQQRARGIQERFDAAAQQAYQTPAQQAGSRPGGPTLDNAGKIGAATGGMDMNDLFRRISEISPMEGLRMQQQFAKQMPEFDTKPQTGTDPATGQTFQYLVNKAGKIQKIDALPRDEMKLMNLGGQEQAYNPFTLQAGQTFKRTMTPGEVSTANTAAAGRAQTERHWASDQNAPQYMDTADGIFALPKHLTLGAGPVGAPVKGPNGAPLEKRQNVPQYVVEGITNNAKSLSSIDAALKSLDTPSGANAVGFKGYLPNTLLNRVDPEGTNTRANIADVGSLVLHDRSGAAVTAAESPRLMPFIPLATDDAVTAKKKLIRFKQIFQAETNNLTFAYPQAKKLADYAAQQGTASPQSSTPDDITDLLRKYGGK